MSVHKSTLRGLFLGAVSSVVLALPALAGDIHVHDPYARSGSMNAKSGAIFLELVNEGGTADRLIAASTDIAMKTELHTHIEDANGVMKMRQIEGGIDLPAGGMHLLKRGGDHIMLMGLTEALVDGETITVTLKFEEAGDMVIEVPIDQKRKPMKHKHGDHDS